MDYQEAIYCMKVMADEEVCEDCNYYQLCDHTKQADMARIAISAMQELHQYKQLGTLEEVREAVEKQHPKKPILKNGKSGMFVDYADGHGEYKVTKWQDWCCPACGWFVGQRYNASQSRSHDQRKSNYCNECGQKIDWSEEDD